MTGFVTHLAFWMQVKFNLLLLECMSSAGRWQEARRHVDALHRSLPLSKQKGPAASKALEALAGWRATCLVKAAAPGKAVQDMPRLLSELSTPQAKVAYVVMSSCPAFPLSELPSKSAQGCTDYSSLPSVLPLLQVMSCLLQLSSSIQLVLLLLALWI